ncbi:MAG: glycine--tRNA ligase [Candidatus Pacebacteria bacterium]|nr:glycine--tRNA ligase [Candidatus Paceibacterota bacterium]
MNTDEQLMEKIISLCKNRGFIFQAGELYGGLSGIYDYGPLGSLLKNNIKNLWIKKFVEERRDTYLLDSAIIMGEKALTASGHVGGFSDPLVDDVKTEKEYRADHLLEDAGINPEGMSIDEMSQALKDNNILSPEGNKLGDVREFNLMLKTQLGSSSDSSSTAYLRPETAQGIFVNYKNIMDSMHPKLPFGVAQIGKAYRNEITPRNFIFRLRELEQMEIEYFIHPDDWKNQFDYWREEMNEWSEMIGIDMNKLYEVEIGEEDRAHYSERTIDFEFDYSFGQKELFGLAYRGDYDLKKHAEYAKAKLQYTDPHRGETFVPHVIEPSMGLDRTILAILTSAYTEDEVDGNTRSYLALKPNVAPYKIAVSPLVKNKEHIVEKANEVFGILKAEFGNVAWDDNGNVGKRYRRQDEIGTPFCVVVDYDTLDEDHADFATVSIRHRDTAEQERISIDELKNYFKEKLSL